MRVIKFRGKSLGFHEWEYGSLIMDEAHTDNGKFIVAYIVPGLPCASDGRDFYTTQMKRVDVSTVGQFTGLLDKNGKEIYEGDVFSVDGKYPKVVKYIEERLSFCVANIDTLTTPPMSFWPEKSIYMQLSSDWLKDFQNGIEVIGNIYDNPELLK